MARARTYADRVNVIKMIKIDGKLPFAPAIERNGKTVSDHVLVNGKDEAGGSTRMPYTCSQYGLGTSTRLGRVSWCPQDRTAACFACLCLVVAEELPY